MAYPKTEIEKAVLMLVGAARQNGRNLFMPGDGRYQPEGLRPFLGYDQWAGWLVIVEWFWLKALALIGEIPKRGAELLTDVQLARMLNCITTTRQDEEEKKGKHDILALLALMRPLLPDLLNRWLHLGLTSYDTICTAYALQLRQTFSRVFWPQLAKVDELWRNHIAANAEVVQQGRTHLQNALPITVGFWLAVLHNRFVKTAYTARRLSMRVPGKATGAVGTSAAMRVLLNGRQASEKLMVMLELPIARVTTQIGPPEEMAEFYFELVLLSGALANLGEDVRILQSSQFRELTSASSGSSTMAHKTANPVAAEQIAGMYVSGQAEFWKVMGTLVSDLQRDLRWSNVMRSFPAVMVYTFQQLLTTERLLKTLRVDPEQCKANFEAECHLQMAELLHLTLQREGVAGSHALVNEIIVPHAIRYSVSLISAMDYFLPEAGAVRPAWEKVAPGVKEMISCPMKHVNLGYAIEIAQAEAENKIILCG